MAPHQLLVVLAVILALLAGVFEWVYHPNPPSHHIAHSLGWWAVAALAASTVV